MSNGMTQSSCQEIPDRSQRSELGNSPFPSATYLRTKSEMDILMKHGMTLREQLQTIRNEFNLLVNDFANIESGSPRCSSRQSSLSTPTKPQSSSHRIRMGVSGITDTPQRIPGHRKMKLSQPKRTKTFDDMVYDCEDKENTCMNKINHKSMEVKIEDDLFKHQITGKNCYAHGRVSSDDMNNIIKEHNRSGTMKERRSSCQMRKSKSIRCAGYTVKSTPNILCNQSSKSSSCNKGCSGSFSNLCNNLMNNEPNELSIPCVRSPGDGASESPSQSAKSSQIQNTDSNQYDAMMSKRLLNKQQSQLMNSPTLPIADILLHRRHRSSQMSRQKASVLGGVSLRGIDGTDLSTHSGVVGDISKIDINDISKIKTDNKDKKQMMTSLRERTSNANLQIGAMHSTLNYPLHSTMKNTMILNGIEPIVNEDTENDDTWSTDSSEFSYDVDEESTERILPPRPSNPAVPCSFDNLSLSFSDSSRSVQTKKVRYNKNKCRLRSQKEYLHHHKQYKDIRYANDYASRDLCTNDQDETLMADRFGDYNDGSLDETLVHQNNMPKHKSRQNVDLDKTVHTGCIALLKRQKLKASKSKKLHEKVNNNNSDVAGFNCYGNSLPINHNILSSMKKVKSSSTKRKHDQVSRSPRKYEKDFSEMKKIKQEGGHECRKRLFSEARKER